MEGGGGLKCGAIVLRCNILVHHPRLHHILQIHLEMIGLFFPCLFIFAALFGGRASAFVVDYPDFLKTDLPGYAKILCNSVVESYLNLSSIGQDPVLLRLGQDISRIGICRPGHTIFFFQRVSDQDIQRLLLIRDQVQQRVSQIQQINLMLALIVISCFPLLALVFLSRAGKRITQAVCLCTLISCWH
jgi:hypothetical protein